MRFHKQPQTHSIYLLVVAITRTTLSLFFRGESYGANRVPKTGSYLLTGNHLSYFDPPAFGASLHRDVFYFARKTLFKTKIGNWTLSRLNTIPVDRDGSDASAMKRVFGLLKQEQGLILFPEGTRSEDGYPKPAQPGVGLMACRTKVAVIPAKIIGTFQVWNRYMKIPNFFYPVDILYGAPMLPSEYDPGESHPDRYQEAANRIMERINALKCPKRMEI